MLQRRKYGLEKILYMALSKDNNRRKALFASVKRFLTFVNTLQSQCSSEFQ
jgi:hypothetical protein